MLVACILSRARAHTHTHTHTHTHIHIHIHIQTRTQTCLTHSIQHAYMPTRVHKGAQQRTNAHNTHHTCTNAHTHTCKHIHTTKMHNHVCTCTHKLTLILTNTRTCAHTHIRTHNARFLHAAHAQVVTGNLRGAGTVAPASIQLIGTHGSTDRFALGDSESELFTRGSSHAFDIPVSQVNGQVTGRQTLG